MQFCAFAQVVTINASDPVVSTSLPQINANFSYLGGIASGLGTASTKATTFFTPATSGSSILRGNGSGGTSAAVFGDIFNLFSGCSGTMYPGFDGACHSPAGGGLFVSYQFGNQTALTATGLYIQTVYPSIFTTVQSGSGTSGAPYINTIGMATFGANLGLFTPIGASGPLAPRAMDPTDVPVLNQNTTGNAATASSAATTPTLCSTGNAPTGVDVNFNATGCAAIGSGSSTPGGSTTQLQYSNAAVFGGTANGTYTLATGLFSYNQLANGNDLMNFARKTDTSPTGFFHHWKNAAGTDLASLDVLGNFLGSSFGAQGGSAGSLYMIANATPTAPPANGWAWGAPSTITTPITLCPPNAVPAANQIMLFPAPTSSHSCWTWTNGSVTLNGQTVTLGASGNVNAGAAAHSVALNQGVGAAIMGAAIGTAGRLLIDQGAGADPAFEVASGSCTVSSGGVFTCSGSGGGSVFTGSTATNPTDAATMVFSLSDISVKSPIRVEPTVLTTNTSVSFTNLSPGATFYLAWTQGSGAYTVTYTGSVIGAICQISPVATVVTTQTLQVNAAGTSVVGLGCTSTEVGVSRPASESGAPTVTSASPNAVGIRNNVLTTDVNGQSSSNTIVPGTCATGQYANTFSNAGVMGCSNPGGVNAQTISYTAVAADDGKWITENGSSLTTTLPATPPSSAWTVAIQNLNASALTISRNGLLLNAGTSNISLPQYQVVLVYTDGTNYFSTTPYTAGSGVTLTPSSSGTAIASTGSGGGGGISGWSISTPASFITTATQYAPFNGGGGTSGSGAESTVQVEAPAAATITGVQCSLSAAFGAGASAVISLRDGGVSETPICTIAAGGTVGVSSGASFNIALGDLVDWQIATSGTVTNASPQIIITYAVGTSGVGTTSFSSGNLSPIFTTTVTGATTTPALSFSLSTFGTHMFLGNSSAGTAVPGAVKISTSDTSLNWYAAGGGTAQAQTVPLGTAAQTLGTGLTVFWAPIATNTAAAPTLVVSALASKPITKCWNATPLVAGDLPTFAQASYDGTEYNLWNPVNGCGGGSGTVTISGASLASTECVTGAGTTVVQTPSANCTVDASGNVTANSLSIGSVFSANSSGLMTKMNNVSLAGNGVPGIIAQQTLTNSSATSLVTLATSPAAGFYLLHYILDLHTPCTTGTGNLYFLFDWTGNSAREERTGVWSLNSTQGVGTGWYSGVIPIDVVSGNVTFTPTLPVACTTGTATWDGRVWLTVN